MKIVILLGLMVFLFGCTQPLSGDSPFQLGESFTLQQGKSYFNEANDKTSMTIEIKSFEDSRCPEGVVCIWEGEQGVTLFVKTLKTEFEIILKETTMPNNSFGTLSFELVSIDIDNGRSEIIVSRTDVIPTGDKQWFSIEPIQCQGNEWDQWFNENGNKYFPCPEGAFCEPVSFEEVIRKWLSVEYNIQVIDYASKQKYDDVCAACDCPRGDEIAVLVNSSNSGKMQELGFTAMGNIVCTEDARVCDDGSVVVRQAPFCEFAACPVVTKDDSEVFVRMFDSPGFVIERTTVVTIIENDGDIIVESTTIDSTTFIGVITEVQKKASEEELQELRNFILTTNFFELTQDDARDCIIDIPTVNLTINLGEESNAINSLGAECDPAKTVEAHEIISKIRELVENAQNSWLVN